MKTREETVEFIQNRDSHAEIKRRVKGGLVGHAAHHYGKQDLRELMDFIYEGEPTKESEMITVEDLDE